MCFVIKSKLKERINNTKKNIIQFKWKNSKEFERQRIAK